MKHLFGGAVLALGLAAGVQAQAADYAVITLDTTVDRPVDAVWAKVGGYCAIDKWMTRLNPCVLLSGTGDVGSIRKLGPTGAIVEVMVAKTAHSYTYTQPTTTILYHGTLAAEPADGGRKTRLVYTMFYDQAPLATPEAQAKNRNDRTSTFTQALASMKALAEAP
jgi:hypothetical protein